MIASRSLFRVDRVLKFVNSYVQSKPVTCCQGLRSFNSLSFNQTMGGGKDKLGAKDGNKKRKTVNPRWRAVSAQANSLEDSSVIKSEQMLEVEDSVTEVTEVTVSTTVEDNVEERASEGTSTVRIEKHSIRVQVAQSLLRFLKGKQGLTQKSIEEELGVKLIFPSLKQDETIIIEGSSIDNITKASQKIQAIIDEAVKSSDLNYSHFISLPLAIHPELVDKLVNFQNSILGNTDASVGKNVESESEEDILDGDDKAQDSRIGPDVAVELKVEDDKHVKVDLTSVPLVTYAPKSSKSPSLSDLGIDKSIFIKPKTFHLTVLMLKLWNKERVRAASEVLQSISEKVMDALGNQPVSVRLKGLDCMRGSLAKARVLYATVEEVGSDDRLSRACQVIIDSFVEAGLVLEKDAKHKLKLHATMMNTSHRRGKRRRNDFFDARGIFKQYGNEEWGEYLIREAHLSQRFVYDDNGYYHCCASIPFPENMQVD